MRDRVTPEKVRDLSKCEIFVFGSNLEGEHYGGAARTAYEKFGAEWGVGVGPSGKSYAIPTMHGGVKDIKPYVDEFIEYARNHPNNRFLVTRIGCGTAGFNDEQMAPLFKKLKNMPNVCLPLDWMLILHSEWERPREKPVPIPKAIIEKDLIRLCREYKYVIGARIEAAPKPEILIRYVIDRDRFGYARFGDFFYTETGNLYVWTRRKDLADKHDQEAVERIFEDECEERGFFLPVIFAGVKTPYKDSNGEDIYTGDVIKLGKDRHAHAYALGTLGENEDGMSAKYAFVLDNHCLRPEECEYMKREGTVFYQLDWNNNRQSISMLCHRFQPWFPDGLTDKERILLSHYTPNFDQELWKYHACEILGIEFNWRGFNSNRK